MDRTFLIQEFLKENNITNYQLQKIAGDASFRHYFRVICGQVSFIVMHAPPAKEDIQPFCKIANWLVEQKFSAPKIFAINQERGLLLLEDFGDESYRKAIEKGKDEIDLYQGAVDLLVDLQKINPPQDLPIYDENLLLKEVMLFIEWYLPEIIKKQINAKQIGEFQNIWLDLFSKLSSPKNLVLRDYHSDNLMVLTNRDGVKKVGLLDFQDAVIGSSAYDLVSLLEDARRPVGKALQQKMLQHYIKQSQCDEKQFITDYQILSLQRNIKIVGIFSRLSVRDHKENYLKFLPIVFEYIHHRLQDHSLFVIKKFLYQSLN